MRRSLAAATLLLFFLLGIGAAAFAGDNENALFTIEADPLSGVEEDDTISISVVADAIVDALQVRVIVLFDPAVLSYVDETVEVIPGLPQLPAESINLPDGWMGVVTASGGTLDIACTMLGERDRLVRDGAEWIARVSLMALPGVTAADLTTITLNEAMVRNDDDTWDMLTVGYELTINETPPVELASVAVDPPTAELKAGETQAFTAAGTGTDGNPFDIEGQVAWGVSDELVGTIDDAGVFTAVGAGTADVTATVDDVSDTASVTVTVPTLASIAVTGPATVTVGQSATFSAAGTDTDGEDMAIEPAWSVSDELVGTIDDAGVFTAVGAGAADVTATVDDVSGTASVTVELPQPGGVSLVQGDEIKLQSLPGHGDVADDPPSRGEAVYELVVLDQTGAPLGGITVTWTVQNMGDGDAWVVGPISLPIPAGSSTNFTTTSGADGLAAITLDSEETTTVRITGAVGEYSASSVLGWQMAVPVELASFSGSPSKGSVVLRWVAASQTNNLGWHIYRAVDGGAFAKIGFVEGAGTTAEVTSYMFSDTDLPSGKVASYYLRQVNADGTAGDSPSISVDLSTAVQADNWGVLKSRFAR
jgi:hypothetical protein